MLSRIKRSLLREPEIPPPVTISYLVSGGVLLMTSISLMIVSSLLYARSGLSTHLAFVVLAMSMLAVGGAELLPIHWRRVSAALRVTGVFLVLVMVSLFVR